ncbi:MAG: ACP S-malonyltransferase [Nitrospirales bacterium]|nr:ACP S-malonyltransferase [Nitrospirales bacterium]
MVSSIGLLFPGQGSQFIGMGRAMYEAFPRIHTLYETAKDILGYDIRSLCFEGPADTLNLTEYTQPAMLLTSIAALRMLDDLSIEPAAVAGHSLGEYSALVSAHSLRFDDAVRLVQKRAQYMSESVLRGSGRVAAVLGLSGDIVKEVCRETEAAGIVAAANFNSPGQVVIAGEQAAVEQATTLLKGRGCRRVVPLPVSVPVHTPLMQQAADRLAKTLETIPIAEGRIPVINNAEAKAIQAVAEIRTSLVQQLPSPVLWEQSMHTMWEMGITTFIEVGPGTVLTGLGKRTLPDATWLNVQDPSSLDTTMNALSTA